MLEITPKHNNGVPAAISLSTWYERYPQTIVVRYTGNRYTPINAAWYGQTFYIDGSGKNNKYSLTSSITSLTEDYCSSLVWKCYHYGASYDYEILEINWHIPTVILPYDYINSINMRHNMFSAVHSVNW